MTRSIIIDFSATGNKQAKYYDVPSQNNNKDCGVIINISLVNLPTGNIMEAVRTFLHEGDGKFRQRDIPDIRKRILRELQNNTLETGVSHK